MLWNLTLLNLLRLSGYEDSRRKGSNGLNLVENSKINKSIYALQNVVYSLNANETHVPYRESKLTHMLQDSLGGASRILMVTCLVSRLVIGFSNLLVHSFAELVFNFFMYQPQCRIHFSAKIPFTW